jgi:hypothetical protein
MSTSEHSAAGKTCSTLSQPVEPKADLSDIGGDWVTIFYKQPYTEKHGDNSAPHIYS